MKLASTHTLLVVLLSLWLTTSAWAGFDEGWAAFERGDYAKAMMWWRLAAEQVDALAQYNLGGMYGRGNGVLKDFVQAYIWFGLAAAQGHENGRLNRDIIANYMTPAQIVEAQRLAREWLEERGGVAE